LLRQRRVAPDGACREGDQDSQEYDKSAQVPHALNLVD
jgi:hypothetical protein